MSAKIIKVVPNRLDQDCMEITLQLEPSLLESFLGKKAKRVTFKGKDNDWFKTPCFSRAPTKIAKLLRAINNGWEFRHLQYQYQKQVNKPH